MLLPAFASISLYITRTTLLTLLLSLTTLATLRPPQNGARSSRLLRASSAEAPLVAARGRPEAQNQPQQTQSAAASNSAISDLLLSVAGRPKNDSLSGTADEFARREYSNDIDDEAEMYTNNHKTASYDLHHFAQPNPRPAIHNNNFAQQQHHTNHHSGLLSPLSFYAKFHQQHNTPNIFVNNYLHSLLHGAAKPGASQLHQTGASLYGHSHNYNLIPPTLHASTSIASAQMLVPTPMSPHPTTKTIAATTQLSLAPATVTPPTQLQSNSPALYDNVFGNYLHKPYYNQMQQYYQSFVTSTPEGSQSAQALSTTTTTTTTTSTPATTTTTTSPTHASLFLYQDQTFDSNQLAPEPAPVQAPPNPSVSNLPGASICGRQQASNREPRIVGGHISYEGEFPWAVSIQRHGNHHCGGVIVGRRWILTAAHCVRSQVLGNLIVRTGGNTLTRSLNSLNSHLERDYFVDQIIMHDDFSRYDNLTSAHLKPSTTTTNNADIALLRLKHEIHWNELAWPVCFPNKDAGNFSGHDAIVIGWGKLNEKSEDFSNDLQKVKLTIIDNKVCQNWFRQAGREMPIDERIICAGYKNGGKDACHGDSGGPLLSKINGQYVVVGVVSTGIGCARPLLPGLYSRVSSYISWIEKHIVE